MTVDHFMFRQPLGTSSCYILLTKLLKHIAPAYPLKTGECTYSQNDYRQNQMCNPVHYFSTETQIFIIWRNHASNRYGRKHRNRSSCRSEERRVGKECRYWWSQDE